MSKKLYVVELEDSGQWPMPTWGPFERLTDAMNWVVGDIDAKWEVTDYDDSPIVRSYALDDGSTYYHIKKLQSPE